MFQRKGVSAKGPNKGRVPNNQESGRRRIRALNNQPENKRGDLALGSENGGLISAASARFRVESRLFGASPPESGVLDVDPVEFSIDTASLCV